jgi:hypothetical protein
VDIDDTSERREECGPCGWVLQTLQSAHGLVREPIMPNTYRRKEPAEAGQHNQGSSMGDER